MIQKLLLVRKVNAKADLIDKLGMMPYSKEKPIGVSPIGWGGEARVSHYGYMLELPDMELLDQLESKLMSFEGVTLHSVSNDIGKTLSQVGLRINSAA